MNEIVYVCVYITPKYLDSHKSNNLCLPHRISHSPRKACLNVQVYTEAYIRDTKALKYIV